MNDESALERSNPKPLVKQQRLRTPSSLAWVSRHLGKLATLQLANVRQLIHREQILPTPVQPPTPHNVNNPFNAWRGHQADDEPDRTPEALRSLVERSHEVIAQAKTVFPFVLFPDTVTLDRTKVTIYKKNFFWSEDVVSIRIEDVLNATAGTNMIFGSLNVSSRVMNSTDHYLIKFLWKQDALHLKHLIQGYVIAQHNNIQVSHLPKEELIKTLEELGHDGRT